jgi:uncharacterized hydrophobic protein (TIGR00271 family)
MGLIDASADVAAPANSNNRSRLKRRVVAWRRRSVVGQVDHPTVLERVHADAHWSGRFAFMVAMSAGIAILGLLLSSPAVIIGAMLISPLMGPIIGLGFALATLDWVEVRRSLLALVAGTGLAIAFTASIVLLSPLQDITSEILARTRPNLFDLLVAIFSALAGGYATVRGRGETIVGVAIATALMPPLAVVGFGLATANMLIFGGALALYVTNFIAITLSAMMIARFYGFGAHLSPRQTQRQGLALALLLIGLTVPLAVSLRQIAWEAWATRTVRSAVEAEFGDGSRIASLDPNFAGDPVRIRTTVFTEVLRDKAREDLERQLANRLQRPVRLRLSQILVNQGTNRAELDRARSAEAEARQDRLARADMAARLSLVTNRTVDEVLVDPVARIATAQAHGNRPLAELMAVEARLAEDSPGWTVRILPPPGPLPGIDIPDEDSGAQLEEAAVAVAWALARQGTNSARLTARQLSGEPSARAQARIDAAAEALRAKGLIVEVAPIRDIDRALEREIGVVAARRVDIEMLPPVLAPAPTEAGTGPATQEAAQG